MFKITVKTLKPRNPFVVMSRARRAGAHSPRSGNQRAQAARSLRRDLDDLARTRQSP